MIVASVTETYSKGMKRFGDFLRAEMKKRRLAIRSFAELCDVSEQTIRMAFKRDTPDGMRSVSIRAIAKGLVMTVEEMDAAWQGKGSPDPRIPGVVFDALEKLAGTYSVREFLSAFIS